MGRLLDRILAWFYHAQMWELERYLAGSSNAADLERRIREWERRQRQMSL